MKSPLKALLIAGLATLALMLAIQTRAQSPGPQTEIVTCDGPISEKKPSLEATKEAPVLIGWIVAQTHWTLHEPPPIRLIASAEMTKMYSDGEPNHPKIEALYSLKDHIIYLTEGWHPNKLGDRSKLLHELVHHLQFLNGIKATCPQESEWQAYQLQVDWLREQGVDDPLELLGINPLFIYIIAHCPEF